MIVVSGSRNPDKEHEALRDRIRRHSTIHLWRRSTYEYVNIYAATDAYLTSLLSYAILFRAAKDAAS